MNICIFGSGYVGLVQAAIFADVGHRVICVDVDRARVERLRAGEIPIFEPGLTPLLRSGIDSNLLSFTTEAAEAVALCDYLFIAVGTPSDEDGSADLKYVLEVASTIAQLMDRRKVVVTKSTVPVGTADKVAQTMATVLSGRDVNLDFDVVSNPEFLKEGSAVADCQRPDRIIIGCGSEQVLAEMRQIYRAFNRQNDRIMQMSARSAEMTKYASNAILATKISFMNEMANLAESVGADIEDVRRGMGSDPRIGYQFIYPGAGYGGSCFPKDVRALRHLALEQGQSAAILTAVHETNERQKDRLGQRVESLLGTDLAGHTIAVWGLAFKPNTDDMREAPSLKLLQHVCSLGGKIQAYDPEAMAACRGILGEREDIRYFDDKEAVLEGATLLVICTEWKTFWSPDFEHMKQALAHPVVIDGRNLYSPVQMKELGIQYYAIGRGLSLLNAP